MTIIVNKNKRTTLGRSVINYWKHLTRVTAKKAESKAGGLLVITTNSDKPQQKHRFETGSVKLYDPLTFITGLKRQTV